MTRQRAVWTLLAGLVVFGIMCVPFFLGRVYVADDLGEFHLPVRDFYSRQLAAGEAWDWMPSLYCGFYLTGEGQLGGYHPLHLLLYRTLPLGAAFNLELLLSYPFMAVGMYLFLRRVVVRKDAAAFGALVFTFSGFNLLHFVHPNAVVVVAHLPWLLWLIDLAVRSGSDANDMALDHTKALRRKADGDVLCGFAALRETSWTYAGIALLLGSQLLLGYPQYVWFSLVCMAAWGGCRWWQSRPSWLVIPKLVLAVSLGLLVGAVQLLPTMDALALSNRQQADAAFQNSGSLHPLNLVQLVAPYLFTTRVVGQNTHELGLYVGAVPIVLCCWLLLDALRRKSLRQSGWFFAILGGTALLYAFGELGPIYRFQAWLPLVKSFRFPCRAIVIVQLAIAVLSALALVRLSKSRQQTASLWVLPILAGAIAAVGLLLWREHCSPAILIGIGPVLLAVAAGLVLACELGIHWAPVALVLFAASDLAVYGLTYGVLRKTSDLNQFAAAQLPPHPTTGRIVADDRSSRTPLRAGNRSLLAGFSRADGYAGLEPANVIDTASVSELRVAGVDWVRAGGDWQKVESPLPTVRLQAVDDAPELRVKSPLTPGPSPRDGARGDSNDTLAHRPTLTFEHHPGRIVATVDGNAPAELIVAERYHSGWIARMDGSPVTIVPHERFMACLVPAGRHQIELEFKPASLAYGRLLTLCGLGLTMSWGAFGVLRSSGTARAVR